MSFLNAPITQNPWAWVTLGLLSSLVSMAPTALSLRRDPSCQLYRRARLENMVLTLPLTEAAINVALFWAINRFFPDKWKRYWVVGALVGLIYPTMGWLSGLPQNVYGVNNYGSLVLTAQVLYGLLYGVGFAWLMSQICKTGKLQP